MSVRIVEYPESLEPAVAEFNARLKAGGSALRFPESHVPNWLPADASRTLFMQYFLAVEDDAIVRGCYGIKHQDYWVAGQVRSVGFIALPLSEGIVNRNYAAIGAQLLIHAIRNKPLLYGLGLGGENETITHLLRAAGWQVAAVPFYFRVIKPYQFLRQIRILRNSPLRRAALDTLAFSGAGWLGGKAFDFFHALRGPAFRGLTMEVADEFSDWADDLWDRCAAEYPFSAVRDSCTLRTLYPASDPRFIRLRVSEAGRIIGWAVLLATDFTAHKQFGSMRLGSIVDVFAAPGDVNKIMQCAERLLRSKKVDLIVTNQLHEAWGRALRICGFFQGPSNFLFATSKKLTELLNESNIDCDELHINRGDGDGPIHL